jgi:hypothetical protein
MHRSTGSMFAVAAGAAALLAAFVYSGGAGAQGNAMSFFVTSANPGKGADFGGLSGADAYCQSLASSAGASGRTWHAYLSTTASGNSPAVNARDRIGKGPWQNAKGEVIAANVDELHSANKLNKQTALTEKGQTVSGSGDPVTTHDILTGSTPDGRAPTAAGDSTCGNWTKSGEGSAIVGHHDRKGLDESAPAKSWNSSHPTKGCALDALKSTGGGGLLYCFAVN